MRKPERIDNVTNLINEIWKCYPDMRFLQLVQYLTYTYNEDENGNLDKPFYEKSEYNNITSYTKVDIIDGFYLEDDKFEEFLKSHLEFVKYTKEYVKGKLNKQDKN